MQLRSLRVGARLSLAFGALLLLILAVGITGVRRLALTNDLAAEATGPAWQRSQAAGALLDAVNAGARAKLTLFAVTDSALRADASTGVARARDRINAAYVVLDSLVVDSAGVRALDAVKVARKVHAASFDSAAALYAAGDVASAQAHLSGVVMPTLDAYVARIDALVALQSATMERTGVAVAATYASGRRATLLLVLAAALAAVGCAWAITVSLTRPLARLTAAARGVAAGDVTTTVAAEAARDELAELSAAFAAVLEGERAMTDAAVRLAAGDVAHAVAPRGDADALGRSMAELREVLAGLTQETARLTDRARAGDLAARGDAGRFRGVYGALLQGMNGTLDAVLAPVGGASAALERLAARDLAARVGGAYHGDHARLALAVDTAAGNLDEAMREVGAAAQEVAAAAREIGAGSTAVADGAGTQAAALEEVSASLQEFASMSRGVADNARELRGITDEARRRTDESAEGLRRLDAAVGRIKSTSDQTAHILRSIDEIAFQTNLLALNAAVEAARAGDAGRGFAVVAEEVRALALRSAEAAKRTAALIDDSLRAVEEGVALTAEVSGGFAAIGGQVRRVADVAAEISSATDQQAQGISQVTTATEQVNAVTQRNAASSEETAAAAEELGGQAARLQDLVAEFRLTGDARPSAAHADPAAHGRPTARPSGAVTAEAPDFRKRRRGRGVRR